MIKKTITLKPIKGKAKWQIKKATPEDIARVVGKKLADNILKELSN